MRSTADILALRCRRRGALATAHGVDGTLPYPVRPDGTGRRGGRPVPALVEGVRNATQTLCFISTTWKIDELVRLIANLHPPLCPAPPRRLGPPRVVAV